MESALGLFNPTQPEFKGNCEFYMEYKPDKTLQLQSEVSLFYQFKLDENTEGTIPVIPDGCIDLLFCCDPSKPFATIGTSPLQRCSYQFLPNQEYFCVRFFPEQSRLEFRCSLKEIMQHQQLPLFDVLNIEDSLLEEIACLPSFKERVSFFCSFFKDRIHTASYDQNLIYYCLNEIYASQGWLNMKDLSVTTGYSDRYLRMKFEEYIGFSPKQFSQIVRLQHSVHDLLHSHPALNTIIDNHGFYDKAHFYKGFKKYMTMTPNQYKQRMMQGDGSHASVAPCDAERYIEAGPLLHSAYVTRKDA